MSELWTRTSCTDWAAALDSYEASLAAQPSDLLRRRDPWYRLELPGLLAARPEPFITHEELVWVVEWKMARGDWRARNLHLVRSNAATEVETASRAAFASIPDEQAPLKLLSMLKGVGPATASAVLAAHRPTLYPFFDDVVAAQMPDLTPGDFTLKAYRAYAVALRARAAELALTCPNGGWTADAVGMALWAAAGGKVG